MKEALDKKIEKFKEILIMNGGFKMYVDKNDKSHPFKQIIEEWKKLEKDVREAIKNILERIEIEKTYCQKDRLPLRKVGKNPTKQAELHGMEYAYEKIKEIIKQEVGDGLI